MVQEVNVNFQLDEDIDLFYSESNIRYLENIVYDIKNAKAHFAEHDLIEVDWCFYKGHYES